MGLVTLMKKLKVGPKQEKKMWFFKINSFLKNENLRLYSLPVDAIIRNLEINNLMKLPDPRDFVIGMNFVNIKKEIKIESLSDKKSGRLK